MRLSELLLSAGLFAKFARFQPLGPRFMARTAPQLQDQENPVLAQQRVELARAKRARRAARPDASTYARNNYDPEV
jgi:hypothetical protein